MTDHGEATTANRGGGRRLDRSRDAAILRAALEGLAELGYDRMSMDEIAARAHSGKGALYRRWPSKAALVADAIVAWRERVAPIVAPNTGSLLGDIEALIEGAPDFAESDRRMLQVISGLATAAARDPELRAAFKDQILERPRRMLREVLERAVVRGEIPPQRELELIPDVLISMNMLRIVLGEVPDREFFRRVFDEIIHPLVTAPSSRKDGD
jgi:AcrR family transcriptional regulator